MVGHIQLAVLVCLGSLVAGAASSPVDRTNFVQPVLRIPDVESSSRLGSTRRSLLIKASPNRDTPCATKLTWWNQTDYTGAKWVTSAPSPTVGCLNIPFKYLPATKYGSLKLEWYAPTSAMKRDMYFVTCKEVHFWPTRNCEVGNTDYLTYPTDHSPPSPTRRPKFPRAPFRPHSISCIYNQDLNKLYSCPPNSTLDGTWAGAKCWCNSGFVERGGKCVDVCTPLNCGSHANCYVKNGAGVCNCTEGYRRVKGKCEAIGHSDFLDPHNAARAAIELPALKWSDSLATKAEAWVAHLGKIDNKCRTMNRSSALSSYGQNLLSTFGIGQWAPSEVVNVWLGEKKFYTYSPVPAGCQTGKFCSHYVQVVARKTMDVGCGSYTCGKAGTMLWACLYWPKGIENKKYPY
ncbi:hypothetical protein CLOM_g1904 [Closterium sp. NIES-68]|nr:hypothetical protein CLOM_g1904 [Closterium sp. NIES-68]GJP82507.1 hypothetical protein CLOP_g12760 [Closterium sp. NIES-67]